MTFERFGMWVFAGMGRLLVVIGSLAVLQRFVVETSLADAFVTALLYGGGLIGFGMVLGKLARLALNEGKPGAPVTGAGPVTPRFSRRPRWR